MAATAVPIAVIVGRNPSHCTNASATSVTPPTTLRSASVTLGIAVSAIYVIVGFALSKASRNFHFKSLKRSRITSNVCSFSAIFSITLPIAFFKVPMRKPATS